MRGFIRGRSGEAAKKEGQNVFDIMTGVSIIILVKNPKKKNEKAVIHYHDIGDYLNKKEKLSTIEKFKSVNNPAMQWRIIKPNEHNDWINQRNDAFGDFIPLGDKKGKTNSFFQPYYSNGVKSNRDAWVYNFSKETIQNSMEASIDIYNKHVEKHAANLKSNIGLMADDVIDFENNMIRWTREVKWDLEKGTVHQFKVKNIVTGIYRPFTKQRYYFDKHWNNTLYQIPKLFPAPELHNRVICVTGVGGRKEFSGIISDSLPDLELIEKAQCFPLYWYEKNQKEQLELFSTGNDSEYIRRDGISDFIFKRAKKQYGKSVTKKDIFYYVYGILHSPEYRAAFANDLKKMLPRLPLLDNAKDFWAFSKAGRALADLHINYETVPPYHGVTVTGADSGFFRVEKMRFPKKDDMVRGTKKKVNDTSTIHLNSKITLSDIPEKAYHYVVNGKSAVEWIMERYQVKTDKKSGITNDPNNWAEEVGNPRYILDVLLSVINVSVQTVDIVDGLPTVDFL